MLPIQIPGLALAGKLLFTQYRKSASKPKPQTQLKRPSRPKPTNLKPGSMVNPLASLMKGLSSAVSQISQRNAKEDYDKVFKAFLPANAEVLVPKTPNSQRYQMADIDGDLHNELIVSYKLGQEIRTMVLKKEKTEWYKAAEISNQYYDTLHYSGFADIKGEGKKQLLIGLSSKGESPVLRGYSLYDGNMEALFSLGYDRFELIHAKDSRNKSGKAHLAVWNKNEANAFDIDLLHWNGSQFESQENLAAYYDKKVVPYYAGRVKRSPSSPSNWYHLAESLVKVGARQDALIAIEAGLQLDRTSEYKERFLALKNKIKS